MTGLEAAEAAASPGEFSLHEKRPNLDGRLRSKCRPAMPRIANSALETRRREISRTPHPSPGGRGVRLPR